MIECNKEIWQDSLYFLQLVPIIFNFIDDSPFLIQKPFNSYCILKKKNELLTFFGRTESLNQHIIPILLRPNWTQ